MSDLIEVCASCRAKWEGAETKHSEMCANERHGWSYTTFLPKRTPEEEWWYREERPKCRCGGLGIRAISMDHETYRVICDKCSVGVEGTMEFCVKEWERGNADHA